MMPALALAGTLFWAAMLVWCILRDREERHIWIFVIVFLNVIGAAIYFAIRVLPQLGLYDKLVLSGRRRREIARVEGELVHLDRPHLWARLGELRLAGGDWAGAKEALERALSREDDLDWRLALAKVQRALGDPAAALALLEPIVAKSPDHAYGESKLLLARLYFDGGRDADALRFYEELRQSRPSAEVRYFYAQLLVRSGNAKRAAEELDRVALEARALPEFGRRNQREWIKRAKVLRRELG